MKDWTEKWEEHRYGRSYSRPYTPIKTCCPMQKSTSADVLSLLTSTPVSRDAIYGLIGFSRNNRFINTEHDREGSVILLILQPQAEEIHPHSLWKETRAKLWWGRKMMIRILPSGLNNRRENGAWRRSPALCVSTLYHCSSCNSQKHTNEHKGFKLGRFLPNILFYFETLQ